MKLNMNTGLETQTFCKHTDSAQLVILSAKLVLILHFSSVVLHVHTFGFHQHSPSKSASHLEIDLIYSLIVLQVELRLIVAHVTSDASSSTFQLRYNLLQGNALGIMLYALTARLLP